MLGSTVIAASLQLVARRNAKGLPIRKINIASTSMKLKLVTAYNCISCKLRHSLQCSFPRALSTSQSLGQNRRPPTAPKQFPNIKHIRQNVQVYNENCMDRNYKAQASNAEKIASLARDSNEITQ